MITPSGNIEHIQFNSTDPWTEVDGERSSIKTKHPLFTDPAVRQALKLLVDREVGARSTSTAAPASRPANFLNNPARFVSQEHAVGIQRRRRRTRCWTRPAGSGRRRHPRQGRQEAEVRLPDLDQPAAPEDPGDRQAGLPEGRHRDRDEVGHGLGVLLVGRRQPRHLPASSTADMQMYTTTMTQPDPEMFMRQFLSWEVATKANKWQGRNITRWQNEEYDGRSRRRRTSSIRSSARRCSSSMNDLRDRRPRRDPGGPPPARRGGGEQAASAAQRLGQRHLATAGLVSRG